MQAIKITSSNHHFCGFKTHFLTLTLVFGMRLSSRKETLSLLSGHRALCQICHRLFCSSAEKIKVEHFLMPAQVTVLPNYAVFMPSIFGDFFVQVACIAFLHFEEFDGHFGHHQSRRLLLIFPFQWTKTWVHFVSEKRSRIKTFST